MLTKQEQYELIVAYQGTKDTSFKKRLIEANLGFVYKCAAYYSREHKEDLVNEGVIALSEAIERFDIMYNVSLLTYAGAAIRWAMIRYLKKENNPKHFSELLSDVYCPDDQIEKYEMIESLAAKLSKLSPRQRTYVLLTLEGYSQADIARKENISPQAVSCSLITAAEKLNDN